jgi:ABC-type lipoprotein release transport system permease subunit
VTDDQFAFDYMGSTLVILYVAGYAGLALFFVALFVWLVHETGVLIRSDQTVLCSLRAIGIPSATIVWSYVSLTAASVAVGIVAAWTASILLGWLAPPLEWHLSGLRASIPWRLEPVAPFVIGMAALLAAVLASWSTARRVQRLNILEGLRSP